MGCCGSKDEWPQDFSPTALSSNKCDAIWEQITGDQATFGMGSHWAPCARFGAVYGVIRVRVGFTGGTEPNPSYNDPKDHTEVVNIQYDPSKVTYPQIIDIFWAYHDSTLENETPQYASAIFYHDEKQKALAEKSVDNMITKIEKNVFTKVKSYTKLYPAEDDYQHYLLQQQESLFSRLAVVGQQIAHSHLLTKVEGFLCGFGKPELFDDELVELYLPVGLAKDIRKMCVQNQPAEENADKIF